MCQRLHPLSSVRAGDILSANSCAMMGKAVRDREFWVLILIGVAYCWRPLFHNETFFFRDLYYHFMPSRQFLADMLGQWKIPLWNPYIHGGQPFLANINNVALYPTALLYSFLPLLTAFNLEISLHLIGCAAAAYILVRKLGAPPAASFVCGVVYGFCGYTLSCATFLNRILAAPYLPLLLFTWHSYLVEGKRRWFLATALCGALLVLAGAPETAMIGFATILVWTLVTDSPRTIASKLGAWLLVTLFAAGLSAVQIIPTLELTRASVRSLGVSYEGATTWSLDPRRLPELMFPGLLGRTDALTEGSYWGGNLENGFPYIPSIYFGVIVLLAAISAVFSKAEGMLPARTRRALLVFAAAATVLSFGRHLPGYSWIYEATPLLKSFRYPIKFLNAALLPVALLSAHAMDVYHRGVQSNPPTFSRRAILFWSGAAVLGAVLLLSLFSRSFSAALQQALFLQSPRADVQAGMVRSIGHALLVWMLLPAAMIAGNKLTATWRPWPLMALLALDLLSAGRGINPTADRHFFSQEPPAAAQVRKELKGGRLFRADFDRVPIAVKAPTDEKIWRYRWELEVLSHSSGVFYRLPLIYDPDYDGLTSLELTALAEYAQRLPWDRKASMMDAGAVSLIMTHETLEAPGLNAIADIPNSSNVVFHLYRNSNACQRVQFCSLPVVVRSAQDALAALVDPRFRPRQHVILMDDAKVDFSNNCPAAKIASEVSSPTSSRTSVTSSCPGWLVFSEPYDAGWKVQVDGSPAPLLKANYAFSAVRVAAGTHVVQKDYQPRSVKIGAAISALSFLILAMIGLIAKKMA